MANSPSLRGRALEVLAAMLLGLATLGSAWCVFQASRWNGEERDETRDAATARLEGSRQFTLAAQKVAYDANIAAQYAVAIADGREDLQRFYRDSLVRPEFLPVLEEWQRQAASGEEGTSNLLQNTAYIDEQFAASRKADDTAAAASERGEDASRNADDYVRNTIFMATALFFAGVMTNFQSSLVRIALLGVAVVVIAIGAAGIAGLPIA